MMKFGAAFIAVALGVVLAIYFGLSELPFLRASNDGTPIPTPAATPTPQLAVRSDFAVAGRYVTSVFNPAMDRLGTPFTDEAEACNGTLSASCQQGLIASDQAVTSTIADLKAQRPPVCIGPQIAKLLADLNTIETGLKAALKGYTDNNKVELQRGLAIFNSGNRPLPGDTQSVLKAQTLCDGQASGP